MRQPGHTSLLSAPGQELTVWPPCSEQPPSLTLKLRWCRWTAAALMIVLAARPCWANSSRLRRKSCLSSGPCTHVSPHTSGGMTRAIATRSSKPKGSSKAILLRRRYSRLASTMRSQPRRDSWRQENSWQPSWMTFMSSRRRHEPVACWTPSPTPSSSRPGWQQTSAKRVSIMPEAAPRRQAYASSEKMFGAATSHQQSVGSLHWACPLATTSSSGPAPTLAWRKSAGC